MDDYENKIDSYISNNRETVTVDKEEYESILSRLTELEEDAEYKPGDTFKCTQTIIISGLLTNNKTLIHMSIPLGKNISKEVKNVKISSTSFNIRAESTYLLPTTNYSTGYNIGDYFAVTQHEENYIRITHTASTSSFSCNNNIPVVAEIEGIKIEFE